MTGFLLAPPAAADVFFFNSGAPDGLIATLSRTASAGKLETETADDFVTTVPTRITNATFIGLPVGGATPANVNDVEIELYPGFPIDSANPPDGRVLTRANSPSDNNFAAADSALGQLTFTTTVLSQIFTAANSVANGINPLPNQFTGGEAQSPGRRCNSTSPSPHLSCWGRIMSSFDPRSVWAAPAICLAVRTEVDRLPGHVHNGPTKLDTP